MLIFKNAIACIALVILMGACKKEGLQGPQGDQGPAGENGTGIGGKTRAISYHTPLSATLSWEQVLGNSYRLKYTSAGNSGYVFKLPDSVTQYIDEGNLLVYMGKEGEWQQLPYTPAYFYDITSYTYTTERISGAGYKVTFNAFGSPHDQGDSGKYNQIRFVILPRTQYGGGINEL